MLPESSTFGQHTDSRYAVSGFNRSGSIAFPQRDRKGSIPTVGMAAEVLAGLNISTDCSSNWPSVPTVGMEGSYVMIRQKVKKELGAGSENTRTHQLL